MCDMNKKLGSMVHKLRMECSLANKTWVWWESQLPWPEVNVSANYLLVDTTEERSTVQCMQSWSEVHLVMEANEK